LLGLPNAWHRKPIGDNVLIAWNATREARRAVADAMIFLVTAKAVTVLLVDAGKSYRHGEEPGADIAMQVSSLNRLRRLTGVLLSGYHVVDASCSDGASGSAQPIADRSCDRRPHRPIRVARFG
jgi:hypothetical protein